MGVKVVTALVLSLVALACANKNTVAPEPARLRVITTPPNASVYIDDHYFGRATVLSKEPKALAPGAHLMTVQAEDHFPHDVELHLPRGITTITLDLRPIPP